MILRRQLPVHSPLSGTAIGRALVSGLSPWANGQGDFRRTLEWHYSADQALLLATGTQALQVALQIAMNQVRDVKVALPAFTCFDVASAAIGAAARIFCYDVQPDTLGPDLESLRRVLERGVRIAVISPLYGFPVDWDAVADLVAQYGAIAVEDAAQGDCAEWCGRPLGSLGPLSVLSFGRGKGWTGGSGGALLIRDQPPWRGLRETLRGMSAGQAGRAAEVRTIGALALQWAMGRPECYAIPLAIPWLHLGETVYRDPVSPRPMTRAALACLAASRLAAAREGDARRAAAKAILAAMAPRQAVQAIRSLPGAKPGYLRLPIRLSRGLAGFVDPFAAKRLGLAPSYPSVLATIPQVGPRLGDEPRNWPGAEELVRTLVTLPTHSLVRERERATLVQLLRDYPQPS